MTLASTAALVAAAAGRGSAVAAFNVITLEHAEAIVDASADTGIAVVLQVSENAVAYHRGDVRTITAACRSLAEQCPVAVSLHLDHVSDLSLLHQGADAGFSSVMYDAGRLPHAENTRLTRAAADWAHSAGLWIEAELGYVGGKADAPASAHAAGVRTDVAEAVAYVEATGVDALAVAVGSSHAMTTRTASLDDALIARLAGAVPVPLVLHGSSGVPDDAIAAAVRAGMRKVNIGTGLNVGLTGSVRRALAADESLVDPRTYLRPGRAAMRDVAAAMIAVVAGHPPDGK